MPLRHTANGPIRGVILDWAGTTVDYGSRAPVEALLDLFARHGVTLTSRQVRGSMGMAKWEHLSRLIEAPEIHERWVEANGHAPSEADLAQLYDEFIGILPDAVRRHAELIPGLIESVEVFRRRGIRIGTTTGYPRSIIDIVTAEAARQGFVPDAVVAADEVPAGRPKPWMCFRAAIEMEIFPMHCLVKVGDTAPDVEEGLNAGMWTIAVLMTGNEIGVAAEEFDQLSPHERERLIRAARERLQLSGVHYIAESIGGVPAFVEEINARLAGGDRP